MKKRNQFRTANKLIVFFGDVVIYCLSTIFSFYFSNRFFLPIDSNLGYVRMLFLIILLFSVVNILSGVYALYNKKIQDMVISTIVNQVLMTVVITFITFFGGIFVFPKIVIATNLIFSIVALGGWRLLIYRIYEKVNGFQSMMVVGSENTIKRVIKNFSDLNNNMYLVKIGVSGNYIKNVEKHVNEVDIVYLAEDLPEGIYRKLLTLVVSKNKQLFIGTSFNKIAQINSIAMHAEDETFLKLTNFELQPEADLLKRLFDIVGSALMLVIAAPILVVTTLLIKVTSPGPVFYKQTRITKEQKEFEILKFRTMVNAAEKNTGPVLATANDSRITPLGKYLRSMRIDELPQLINVLKGDMSLVGPRPERPHFVNEFQKENQYYYLRHTVRAGITGYAQVNGKYITDYQSKLKFDLIYIKKHTMFLDLKIMFQTIKILFNKASSEGITNTFLQKDINIKVEFFE